MSETSRIGVFTSGGDAPGMNAATRAVVRHAIQKKVEVCGIFRGFQGMIDNAIEPLNARSVANILQRGGTVLKSARSEEFLSEAGRAKACQNLRNSGIDGLIAVGGDGTFKGAQALGSECGIPIVGVPGTIDNDLAGTDYTIGFDTAVNTVIESVDKIRDTALSHNRLFFIEVMGRDSGYIAIHAGIASGAAAIMIPERYTGIEELAARLEQERKSGKTSSIVIVAEGGKSGNAVDLAHEFCRRYPHYETKVTVLGHVQRGGAPTAFDRILATRLGFSAVGQLLAGRGDSMVGVVDNRLEITALKNAIYNKLRPDEQLLKIASILSS